MDIRNHQSLVDSLEQFVKGDLLEGANAYHCEKCDKKVIIISAVLLTLVWYSCISQFLYGRIHYDFNAYFVEKILTKQGDINSCTGEVDWCVWFEE